MYIHSTLTSEFRTVDNAVGATVDTGGGARRWTIHVIGGDVYCRAGLIALAGVDVVVAGATRSVHLPNGLYRDVRTSDARLAFRCAAGVTANVHITEEA